MRFSNSLSLSMFLMFLSVPIYLLRICSYKYKIIFRIFKYMQFRYTELHHGPLFAMKKGVNIVKSNIKVYICSIIR